MFNVIHVWLSFFQPLYFLSCRYLHESFQPPIVHQNFEPANVLLDNRFSVRVAECGLEKLLASSSVTQVRYNMCDKLFHVFIEVLKLP